MRRLYVVFNWPDLSGRAAPEEGAAWVAGNGPVVEVGGCRAPAHAALRLQHCGSAILPSILPSVCNIRNIIRGWPIPFHSLPHSLLPFLIPSFCNIRNIRNIKNTVSWEDGPFPPSCLPSVILGISSEVGPFHSIPYLTPSLPPSLLL